jgi:O-antigen ligase/tetratricopeptide (TPR) repeat protein
VRAPLWIIIAAIVASVWMGGHVLLDAQAADPGSLLYDVFVGRTNAAVSQAIIGTLALLSFLTIALKRVVIQIPAPQVLVSLFALWALLAISIPGSKNQFLSLHEFACWTCCVAALLACSASIGRGTGARLALLALLLGASFVSLFGISEFMSMSRTSPNWRVFGGWQNPNALGGILALAIPVGISLLLSTSERLGKQLIGLGVAVCMAALWLTASKGALLSAVAGLSGLVVLAGRSGVLGAIKMRSLGLTLLTAVALLSLITMVARVGSVTGVAGAGSRLLSSGGEAEQSMGFRKRLWADSVGMIRANPVTGVGLGNYQQGIKKYTTTQGAALAHNEYLQIGAEAGLPALVALISLLVCWFSATLRRHPASRPETSLLRFGVVAAVLVGVVNGAVESNLSYFGFSVVFFSLLGIGLLLSVDGVMPERAPFLSRLISSTALCGGSLVALWATAYSDYQVSSALQLMQQGNLGAARETLERATSVVSMDPQSRTQLSRIFLATGETKRAIESARTALSLAPTAMRYVYLAQAYESEGDFTSASKAYSDALAADPHNPFFMRKRFEFLESRGETSAATEQAKALVEAENSDFVKLTALPWLVNTDSVGARIYLASNAENPAEQANYLDGAAEILRNYMTRTYPELLRLTGLNVIEDARSAIKKRTGSEPSHREIAAELGLSQGELSDLLATGVKVRLAGESIADASDKYDQLKAITGRITSLYRTLGDEAGAARSESRLEGIDGPLR